MDIKLKSHNWRLLRTVIAFLLCVGMTVGSLVGFILMILQLPEQKEFYTIHREIGASLENVLWAGTYEESVFLHRDMEQRARIMLYALNYQQECGDGSTVSAERLEMAIRDLFYDDLYQDQDVETWQSTDDSGILMMESRDYTYREEPRGNYDNPAVRAKFKEEHAEEIEKLKEQMILSNFLELQEVRKLLDAQGVRYYATDGTYTITNMPEGTEGIVDLAEFTRQPAHLLYEKNELVKVPAAVSSGDKFNRYFDRALKGRLDEEYNQELKLYLAFDDHYLAEQSANYRIMRNHFVTWLPIVGGCLLTSVIAFVYLVVTTGRKDAEGQRKSYKIDKGYSEIYPLGIVICGIFTLVLLQNGIGGSMWESYYSGTYWPSFLQQILAILLLTGCLSLALALFLSGIRKMKNGRFGRDSVLYQMGGMAGEGVKIVYHATADAGKAFYHGGGLMRQVILITLGLTLLAATAFLAPVAIVLVLFFVPKWVARFQEIQQGVREMKAGNLAHEIPIKGDGPLDELARDLNEISGASEKAIHNELKSQRLKTDLISNVSHDLRTPLTSIITYVDLLKKEGLDSVNAAKYLDVLDQKSRRLYQLTEDLFEAAKASSGEISVQFEKVDLLALINQGLGEMANKIHESELEFRVNAVQDKYYVHADGLLLWRVVENLLSNVLKYAQKGSRVYLDLKELAANGLQPSRVTLEIKNISGAELNIDADELMERFKRGDESRTTEGSGLGLAIAKDLAALQKGKLEIIIDGDLFKAMVTLERYEE